MLPKNCPSCQHTLQVKKMRCPVCQTEVDGLYPLPILASLNDNDQEFILQFIKASGSLKEMAKIRKLSYPTVRNKLNDVIKTLEEKESNEN